MLTHASVFSGIGGPEIAAAMLGWENLFHCEIQDFPRKVLEFHFPKSKSYKDVTKTDFTEWRGKVDVLSGGFPCQPFSYAGKRRGAADPRYLWPQMCRVIEEVSPSWVICENVNGIATMAFSSSQTKVGCQSDIFGESNYMVRKDQYVLYAIIRELEKLGYSVQPFVIPALAVGARHLRNRVFIVAENSNSERSRLREVQELERLKQQRNIIATSDNGNVADTDGERSRQSKYNIQYQVADGAESQRNGGKWDALQSTERWRNFPSVSPIYGGAYGFPFNVDNLTIPFTEWRRESLKAYGNAIVPQVIYEIFYNIEQLWTKLKN